MILNVRLVALSDISSTHPRPFQFTPPKNLTYQLLLQGLRCFYKEFLVNSPENRKQLVCSCLMTRLFFELSHSIVQCAQRSATTMPGNCPKKSQDSDWTFNFRTSSRFFDDSDSDSAPNDEDTLASTPSAKDRLLDGIDLSTREETVVYKPNPFSIAKINAANRAQNEKHRAQAQARPNISGSPRRRSKLVAKPTQITVLHGFKIQAQKESLRIKPAASPAQRSRAMEAPVLAQEPSSQVVPNVASASPVESGSVSSSIRIHQHMEGQYATPFLLLNRILYFFLCLGRSCPRPLFLSTTRIY